MIMAFSKLFSQAHHLKHPHGYDIIWVEKQKECCMNKITMEIRDDLNRKMRSCLNDGWTPTQCWHYAYGVERTIRKYINNNEDFEEALHLLHSFMSVMELFMKYK